MVVWLLSRFRRVRGEGTSKPMFGLIRDRRMVVHVEESIIMFACLFESHVNILV
jgi:hypothetical protein